VDETPTPAPKPAPTPKPPRAPRNPDEKTLVDKVKDFFKDWI